MIASTRLFLLIVQNTIQDDNMQPDRCPHSLRSYHHLFPILAFEELSSPRRPRDQTAPRTEEASTAAQSHRQSSAQHEGNQRSEESSEGTAGSSCFGCMRVLDRSYPRDFSGVQASGSGHPVSDGAATGGRVHASPMVLKCPTCEQIFCYECDVYIHESLHNCPGCETLRIGTSSGSRVKGEDMMTYRSVG